MGRLGFRSVRHTFGGILGWQKRRFGLSTSS
jgi:hypothetical protein